MDTIICNYIFKIIPTLITALIGLLGVWIGARIHFRAQAQVLYRREWINALRDSIAEFQSIAVRFQLEIFGEGKTLAPAERRDKIEQMALLVNKVAILLDSGNKDHKKLEHAIKAVEDTLTIERDKFDPAVAADALNNVYKCAREVIANEFKKMTKGK